MDRKTESRLDDPQYRGIVRFDRTDDNRKILEEMRDKCRPDRQGGRLLNSLLASSFHPFFGELVFDAAGEPLAAVNSHWFVELSYCDGKIYDGELVRRKGHIQTRVCNGWQYRVITDEPEVQETESSDKCTH